MRIFTLLLFVTLLFMPDLTWAKGNADVANGLHNLSATGVDPDPYYQYPGSSLYVTNEDQICVFCHTPHGGSLDGPLWNKGNPNSSWTHYNSASMSIDPSLPVGRTPNAESLLCLSCHDGSVSVNHVLNLPNDRDGAPILTAFGGDADNAIYGDIYTLGPGKRIGASWSNNADTGDLSDDHPISFSYIQVYGSDAYTTGSKIGQLKDVGTARSKGVEFFGGASVENVECSSCHDPHVDYISDPAYTPFLITPNAGSELCLACHTK